MQHQKASQVSSLNLTDRALFYTGMIIGADFIAQRIEVGFDPACSCLTLSRSFFNARLASPLPPLNIGVRCRLFAPNLPSATHIFPSRAGSRRGSFGSQPQSDEGSKKAIRWRLLHPRSGSRASFLSNADLGTNSLLCRRMAAKQHKGVGKQYVWIRTQSHVMEYRHHYYKRPLESYHLQPKLSISDPSFELESSNRPYNKWYYIWYYIPKSPPTREKQ